MKKIALLLLSLILFYGCKDDDPSPDSKLLMTFDPRFGGSQTQMGEVHDNLHGYPFYTEAIKFYISNIRLHSDAGSELMLSEIELIDLMENKRSLEFVIPNGRYTGISYDLGVPVEMNGTQNPDFNIALYSNDHPLSESNGMYWIWNTGYRFFTFEGRYDTLDNETGTLPLTFAFHTGTDTLFRSLGPFSKNMNLDGGNTMLLPFVIEIDSIFATAADTVDLAMENSFHGSPQQLDLGIRMANNMAKSIVLDD